MFYNNLADVIKPHKVIVIKVFFQADIQFCPAGQTILEIGGKAVLYWSQ